MKPDGKSDKKVDKKSSTGWLPTGVICLLAGGTIAARMLLLVDNDLEIKTKFAGKSWQLDLPAIRKYVSDTEKFATDYLNPLGANLQQESTQAIDRAGAVLTDPKNWCIPTSDLSAMFNRSDNSNPIANEKSGTKNSVKATPISSQNHHVRDFCIN
jgi:hypothetical protein